MRIVNYLVKLFWWEVDYAYIIFSQISAFLRPFDPSKYKFLNTKSSKSVLIIPGIFESWQIMRPVAEALLCDGYRIHILTELGYNKGSVEQMAGIVEEYMIRHDV